VNSRAGAAYKATLGSTPARGENIVELPKAAQTCADSTIERLRSDEADALLGDGSETMWNPMIRIPLRTRLRLTYA
jgi:hypothetical protein